jgi:hypothetical protein
MSAIFPPDAGKDTHRHMPDVDIHIQLMEFNAIIPTAGFTFVDKLD